ncbi:hypothetical protein [Burkholderia ubonensis]|uniref:hypothetical protein n=1 Tax=Burkholderia ubonensis TaxID=101571 RepID=UPI000758AAAD|nr:hypothetical protein [Burkholderia ubonensis]KVP17082.1 hypothetical protein WJ84_02055 [Burkholderia ubonensis]KVP39794.1 hypothetical protein WJ87_06320 [Burkholderia ubonensis]
MNIDQINALNRFALKHKRGWKDLLDQSWMRAAYPACTSDADKALLQQLRNNGGPSIVATFRPREDGYKKVGFLKQDRMERFNLKRGWFVNAWRIVTEAGTDLVQPWSNKKTEARETAAELGIFLAGTHQ